MLRLYDYSDSGNGYKVRLLLSMLGRPFDRIECDILKGETRTPAFLAKNPNGRIPVLETEDGQFLAESNAILFYLADGTGYLADDAFGRARTLQWLFFEQYSHEPNIATSRFWLKHTGIDDAKRAALADKRKAGHAALAVMDGHLAENAWFVGERFGIADIALYAYTHVADEGGFDLADYPGVRAWIARVAALRGHVSMTGE